MSLIDKWNNGDEMRSWFSSGLTQAARAICELSADTNDIHHKGHCLRNIFHV